MAADRKYELYHPRLHSALARALSQSDRSAPLTASGFTEFSACVQEGIENICYDSCRYETPNGIQMFWITEQHAVMIGKALAGASLKSLMLRLTMFEKPAWIDEMIQSSPGASIDTFTISHASGDEETPASMRALARAADHFAVRRLVVWSAEYESGALEALGQELTQLANRTLREIEICDTSLPDGQDRVSHPAIDAFLARA